MKSLPLAALALTCLIQPVRAQIQEVKDAAQASAAVAAAVAKAPEHRAMMGEAPVELAPLLMFLPYGDEFEGADALNLETLEDAKAIARMRFSYWAKAVAVLEAEAERRGGERSNLKEETLSAEPMSEQVRRMRESVALQREARTARMIAADAAADLKAVESIQSLEDKALLKKIGAEVLDRKSKLFSALSGAEKNQSASGR